LVDFIEHRVQQDSETAGVVRVMTTHFSKGLGMDMVILPELDGKNMSEFRDHSGITLHRDARGRVAWGLSLPSDAICSSDDTLSAAREHIRARQTYENFCVLYVGMTRAKHALYCLYVRGRKNKNAGLWLDRTFPGSDISDPDRRVHGNPLWYRSFAPVSNRGPVIQGTPVRQKPEPTRHARPSGPAGRNRSYEDLIGGSAARRLGSEVHAILSRIEWLQEMPDLAGASPEASGLLKDFLASERAAFMRNPGTPVLLWRERAFDVMIDGQMISGIFDRVQIALDQNGTPLHATVYDFKTGADSGDRESVHQSQMASYASAVARLLGLDIKRVTTKIVPVGDRAG